MRRRKRHITGWVALGLAIVATVPVAAQARLSQYGSQTEVRQPMELGLSEGKIRALGLLEQSGMKSRDNRSFPTAASENRQAMELGLSQGKIRALGLEQSGTKSPDDRAFSRVTNVDPTPVVSHSDRTVDVNAYTVSGLGIALFFAMAIGMGIVAVWHGSRTKLTPA